ncbi:MAG: ABC transporter ATP-binding protein [Candidatus Saccharibacteria bacterium]
MPAIKELSLVVHTGEVYGFLGANGAGKSTTIRTIMGFLHPTSGTIKLLGRAASEKNIALHHEVGYLSGDVVLPKRVTGRKLLAYLGALSGGVDTAYLEQLAERFQAQLDKPTDELSKGNRQKIGIIQALMHQPKIIILDEPTSGLDPLMQEQFYKTVEEARARGAAVLLSSHSFDEVERICDRIGIIQKGKLVYEGTVAQIVADNAPRWRVTLKHLSDVKKLMAKPGIKIINATGPIVIVEPTKSIESALGVLATFPIMSMTIYQRELEEEFMSFYGEKEGENS